MPKAKRDTALYRRGAFWLDWELNGDGSRRPFLATFWYDSTRRRVRRSSTGTGQVEEAKQRLDALYLEHTTGETVCPTCHRAWDRHAGHRITNAVSNYLDGHATGLPSEDAIRSRLDLVLDYLETSDQAGVTCDLVDERWISTFRTWAAKKPIVSPKGAERQRSLATVEASVVQLAAAINDAKRRRDVTEGPAFRAQLGKVLNRTPDHRSDIDELAAMFRYCVSPKAKDDDERRWLVKKRSALHRFLIISVATLARPDAAYDVSTDPKRRQWVSKQRILRLNPNGRPQTKKGRATVPLAWQAALHLDNAPPGFFVGVKSIRRAWEGMAAELGLPGDREAGTKLIRRSMAKLLRDRLPKGSWPEVVMFLGHAQFDATSAIYAPFDPDYLGAAVAEIESIIDEVEALAPGAFALPGGKVVTLGRKA